MTISQALNRPTYHMKTGDLFAAVRIIGIIKLELRRTHWDKLRPLFEDDDFRYRNPPAVVLLLRQYNARIDDLLCEERVRQEEGEQRQQAAREDRARQRQERKRQRERKAI